MKTAVIYASTHGTTEKVATQLKEILGNENTDIINLKKQKKIDLSQFNKVIIGGSIHAGNIQMKIKKFLKDNKEILLKKELGLYLCCMNKPDYEKQFNNAFPEELRQHAKATQIMGGEFIFEKMNFFQKAIVKKVSGFSRSFSTIDDAKIKEFASKMQSA